MEATRANLGLMVKGAGAITNANKVDHRINSLAFSLAALNLSLQPEHLSAASAADSIRVPFSTLGASHTTSSVRFAFTVASLEIASVKSRDDTVSGGALQYNPRVGWALSDVLIYP